MSHELTKSVLAAVPVPCVLVGHDERVLTVNAPAQALFGPGGEGRHYYTYLRQPALLDCVETTLRLRSTRQIRYLTTDMNRDATFEVSASPVEGSSGEAVLLCFEDVTQLEQAREIRRDFVANVSHELKTPLTALLGFIETLGGAARDDAQARDRFLAIMLREAERMNRLVRDLLSLSRVESEERMRPTERVDIVRLVNNAAAPLRAIADDAEVELELIGHKAPVFVQGDEDQLTQVFTNLIENGIKYGTSGKKVTVAVTYTHRELAFRGPGVRVDVIDYGEGFDPVHIPRLTERFYRVDSHRSREMGGTGLGLAIVKHIVNRHRGRFRIESQIGEGSKFSVVLPVD